MIWLQRVWVSARLRKGLRVILPLIQERIERGVEVFVLVFLLGVTEVRLAPL